VHEGLTWTEIAAYRLRHGGTDGENMAVRMAKFEAIVSTSDGQTIVVRVHGATEDAAAAALEGKLPSGAVIAIIPQAK
jgi:hypothetical protein